MCDGLITGQRGSASISSQGQIANLDSLDDVFGKAARRADSSGPEVLTKQGFSTTAVEALVTLKRQRVVRICLFMEGKDAHS